VNIGADYQDHGRFPEAIAEYASVIRLTSDPKLLTVAYENLGSIYYRVGDSPRALESYKRVLQINPEETRAIIAIGALRSEQIEHR
jgi:tetratricopeptide (TPR) repeat protein